MALFGKKKTVDTKEAAPVVKKTAKKVVAKKVAKVSTVAVGAPSIVTSFSNSSVIIRPRITEKSGILSQQGVYTFEVTPTANKNMISSAVQFLFKVVPVKIAIVNLPARKVFIRGRNGSIPGVRKAMVTLKKGDKIDFV